MIEFHGMSEVPNRGLVKLCIILNFYKKALEFFNIILTQE